MSEDVDVDRFGRLLHAVRCAAAAAAMEGVSQAEVEAATRDGVNIGARRYAREQVGRVVRPPDRP